MTQRKNKITLVVGRKSGGKSTLTRRLLSQLSHTIAIDPMQEFPGAIAEDFQQAAQYLDDRRFSPGCRLALRTLDVEDELRLIALAVHGRPANPLLPGFTIAIDEADRLCSPSQIPPELHRAVNYGRHFGISLILVSRRPGALHGDMRALADEIYIGATQLPRDVDHLAEFFGQEVADRARAITDPGHFLHWRLGESDVREILPDDRGRTGGEISDPAPIDPAAVSPGQQAAPDGTAAEQRPDPDRQGEALT